MSLHLLTHPWGRLLVASRYTFGAVGIVAATASCAFETARDESEIAQLEEELRIGGTTPAVDAPWTAEPTVIHKVNFAMTGTTFNTRQAELSALGGYYPSLLASAQKSGSSARYVGAWHKDDKVTSTLWDRNIADADFGARFTERSEAGYEFFDYNVHVDGTTPYYDTIWVKRTGQRPWAGYRNQSVSSLTDRIASLRADGFRPKRINEYTVSGNARYTGLWVADGLTDFKWTVGKSSADILSLNNTYVGQGYRITDLSPNNNGSAVVYSAIWLKNSEIRAYSYDSSMTEAEFHTRHASEVNSGRVLVDINLFYNTSGSLRYSAIWHRNTREDTLESNVSTAAATTLRNTIASFSGSTNARVGFFVQNLTSGEWLGYNMHEPFYMASTTKVFVGSRVIDDERTGWDPLALRVQDWRGEANRGWTAAEFNGNTYPLDDFLGNMLNSSDTASTDRLWGLIEADSAGSLGRYIRNNMGVQNVGEVTTICELDRRIHAEQDACALEVSCDTFEAWLRAGDSAYRASATETACLALLSSGSGANEGYRRYYATLANSITPSEYGRALADISGTELANAERERLFDIMDDTGDGGFSADRVGAAGSQNLYDRLATKSGGKRWMAAQSGIMFDWAGVAGDYSNITPLYTFAVFVKNDTTTNGTPAQGTWMNNVVRDAVRYIR